MDIHQDKIIIYPSILVERIEPTNSSTMDASGFSSTPKASTSRPTNPATTPSPPLPLKRKVRKTLRSPIKSMISLDQIPDGPGWQVAGRRRRSTRRLDLSTVDEPGRRRGSTRTFDLTSVVEFPHLSLSRTDSSATSSSAASSNGDPYKKDVDKAVR